MARNVRHPSVGASRCLAQAAGPRGGPISRALQSRVHSPKMKTWLLNNRFFRETNKAERKTEQEKWPLVAVVRRSASGACGNAEGFSMDDALVTELERPETLQLQVEGKHICISTHLTEISMQLTMHYVEHSYNLQTYPPVLKSG